MSKPIIGIMGNYQSEDAGRPEGGQHINVNNAYMVSVISAGGLPLIMPLTWEDEVTEAAVQAADGLIVTGGGDINPLEYGEEPTPKQGFSCAIRDHTDFCAIRSASRIHRPILGICRGIQSLNVAFGGTLYQDVSLNSAAALKHHQEAAPNACCHTVHIQTESRLYNLLGSIVQTNSFHHQAICRVASGFRIGATASDGIIEEIEQESDEFVVGIQWHPELMAAYGDKTMQGIFDMFVSACIKK
ncbi:MAG: gamma-glutamyl-gamma-aminobutyrate hydrolase family protein [Clostridia bacterium]|jgi:putative glutamine amidotransferase|nr:gamma-glutamyl-gamma-aminobutyrate hydrolase family protein [Clostridia bacterium]